jgi:hypothetical protein
MSAAEEVICVSAVVVAYIRCSGYLLIDGRGLYPIDGYFEGVIRESLRFQSLPNFLAII